MARTPDSEETAIAVLRRCQTIAEGDPELAHRQGVTVLCTMLKALGYEKIVREFLKIGKMNY